MELHLPGFPPQAFPEPPRRGRGRRHRPAFRGRGRPVPRNRPGPEEDRHPPDRRGPLRPGPFALKERDFGAAARARGPGTLRTIFRHIFPNALAPILVWAPLWVA